MTTGAAQGEMAPPGIGVFQRHAARYDAWFESDRGRALFASEVRCLRRLSNGLPRPWLEVGVGTGRFAQALAVDVGADPALRALSLAAQRGVQVVAALGEALPFPDHAFGTVLVIVTICFADDPEGLLREARRVTSEGGVVLGIVPAASSWGRFYAAKGRRGHLFYSRARFFSLEDLDDLARRAGLRLEGTASTLLQEPEGQSLRVEAPQSGIAPGAGFVALRYCGAAADWAAGR